MRPEGENTMANGTIRLPAFADVIKGRDVEDPVNLWVHRPLAYLFVALTLRTPLTPNQITLLAMFSGIGASLLWLQGDPLMVPLGGFMLWASAILDGADGIMARAKHMHSDLGRALDGSADMIVALFTVAAGMWHIWRSQQDFLQLAVMPVALITAVIQIWLYDYFKECYQNSTNPSWDGLSFGRPEAAAKMKKAEAENAPLLTRLAWNSMLGMLGHQHRFVKLVNGQAIREGLRFKSNEETARLYRKYNYWPMQLWSLVSLCPHTYVIAICAIFNRLELYLWYRVFVGNGIWLAAVILQRRATRRFMADMDEMGMSPERVDP